MAYGLVLMDSPAMRTLAAARHQKWLKAWPLVSQHWMGGPAGRWCVCLGGGEGRGGSRSGRW